MKQTIATLQATSKRTTNNHIEGIANSLTTSRDGTLIAQEAAKTAIGQTVPLLLAHNWESLPIGSATMTDVDEDGLHYDGTIFEDVDNRAQILEGIGAGVLAVSVGFLANGIDESGAVSSLDLLELSITPVPADAKASVSQELKFEQMEELEDMDKDKEREAETQAEPEAPADGDDKGTKDQTIQDVLDQLAGIQKDLEDIKNAVEPEDSGDDSDKEDPAPDKQQELDKAKALMLSLSQDSEQEADVRRLFSDFED